MSRLSTSSIGSDLLAFSSRDPHNSYTYGAGPADSDTDLPVYGLSEWDEAQSRKHMSRKASIASISAITNSQKREYQFPPKTSDSPFSGQAYSDAFNEQNTDSHYSDHPGERCEGMELLRIGSNTTTRASADPSSRMSFQPLSGNEMLWIFASGLAVLLLTVASILTTIFG